MLLRSSSTPILASLLSPFPDNLHNSRSNESPIPMKAPLSSLHPFRIKRSPHQPAFLNMNSSSSSSSPSPSLGLRRAQSEGNLEALGSDSFANTDQLGVSNRSSRPSYLVLETIPSFGGRDMKEDGDIEGDDGQMPEENFDIQDCIEREFKVVDCDLKENCGYPGELNGPGMYLAKGLGINQGVCFGRGYVGKQKGGDGRESLEAMEEYYRREIDENPGHPLLLRNYAEFLYHRKRDLERAEQLYRRAMVADPNDGEVVSRYAMLVWELHGDKDRALFYFSQALKAAPSDSHVAAAYASFLWEVEEDEDGDDAKQDIQTASSLHVNAKPSSVIASAY